jgi:hypothetical protein
MSSAARWSGLPIPSPFPARSQPAKKSQCDEIRGGRNDSQGTSAPQRHWRSAKDTSQPKPRQKPTRDRTKQPIKKSEKHRTMLTAEYLRRQAEACLHIARACFDLTSAERLRLMAVELKAKAAEIEKNEKNQENDAFASP